MTLMKMNFAVRVLNIVLKYLLLVPGINEQIFSPHVP